ncbi:hypothetical protein IC582_001135 [Cucumis melo]
MAMLHGRTMKETRQRRFDLKKLVLDGNGWASMACVTVEQREGWRPTDARGRWSEQGQRLGFCGRAS